MTNTGNVAHSINGSKGGVGFMVVPDYTSKKMATECFQGTGLRAYKNSKQGAMWIRGGPTKVIFSKMIMVDNILGLGLSMT